MLSKLMVKLFGPKKKSKAAGMYDELVADNKQHLMPGCEPIQYNLKLEIPAFTKELAQLSKKSVDDYIEFLLVESLYANRLHNSIKMDGYMPPDVSYRKPPKLYN